MIRTRIDELIAIKGRKEGRRITRVAVAQETGLSYSSVTNWANSSLARFDAYQIITFCNYFDCEVGELFEMVSEDDEEAEMKTLAPAV